MVIVALKSTLLHEIIDFIVGFFMNHENIFKIDFLEISIANLREYCLSPSWVSYYDFIPLNYVPS